MATKAKRKPNKRKPNLTILDEALEKLAARPSRWIKTKIKIGAEGRKKKKKRVS